MEKEINNVKMKKEIKERTALGIVLGVVGMCGFIIGGVVFYKLGVNEGFAKGAREFSDTLADTVYKYGRVRLLNTEHTEAIYMLSVGKKFGKEMLEKTIEEFDTGKYLTTNIGPKATELTDLLAK